MELWVNILDYDNYEVSSLGQVRNKNSQKILTPYTGAHGYLRIDLHKKGNKKVHRVHTLVLEAFKGKAPEGLQCRHLDHNKQNCQLSNLEWATQQRNIQDNFERGACKSARGEQNGNTSLTWVQVREIRTKNSTGTNCRKLSIEYGIGYTTCANILANRTWKEGETI